MKRIAAFAAEHARAAWSLALLAALGAGLLAGQLAGQVKESERLSLLATEAERRGIEIMSQTLNGNLMGSVTLLGLIDENIKREARGEVKPNGPQMAATLESVGRSLDADGVFVIDTQGVVQSSWDNSGKPSTGLNVKFRPYFQMAQQGLNNVYAAVSIARGDRSLYFAAPIYADSGNSSDSIGAVVARTGLVKFDNLLKDKADIAVLLSPQGVVFASSRPAWVGHLDGAPTPERLKAIRTLKQFGNLFENQAPALLPVATADGLQTLDGKRYAVASAKVQWNDPFGDWRLVLLEDLARTVPPARQVWVGIATSGGALFIGLLLLGMLRSHHAQAEAARQIETYARTQEATAARKTRLAGVSLRLQQARDMEELGQAFLGEAHALLGALQGTVYLRADDATPTMRLAASYGCATAPMAELAPGEGLLGQCAIEHRGCVIATPTDDSWTIRSGLGDARPAALMLAPLLLNDKLLGVAEIATLGVPDDDARAEFDEIVGFLALDAEILRRSQATEERLATTARTGQETADQLAFQQALVDTIPYPVFYKDADTRFSGFNRAYETTFNVKREDLIGKRVLDLEYLPEADRRIYQAEDEATIASAGSVRREMRIPFADGQLHDTLYYVSGFRRADGTPGGLVGTFIDIGQIKDAERNLERLADAERFNRLAQSRELRIIELKREVNALAQAAGQEPPYATTLIETIEDHQLAPHPDYQTATEPLDQTVQLADLVDLAELQILFGNYCEAIGIAAAIIDLQGKVLVAARWQPVCTDFHRVNPATCARCIESDTELALKLDAGQEFTMYKCKNGMTDCAAPIIVEGRHLANVFIGQFHVAPPDLDFFRQQAKQFGFAEEDYLRAVAAAPVMSEGRLPVILGFLTGFARMIGGVSLARQRADSAQQRLQLQAELLRQERLAAMSLAEDAAQARSLKQALRSEQQR
jgi:PAS domain S-box-containing protein